MSQHNQITQIATLNDTLRTTGIGGNLFVTAALIGKGDAFMAKAIKNMRNFSSFTKDNDPYGEHDFGSFTVDGEKVFWKIDYYDLTMESGSENPADPAITKRVLTLMLASDY